MPQHPATCTCALVAADKVLDHRVAKSPQPSCPSVSSSTEQAETNRCDISTSTCLWVHHSKHHIGRHDLTARANCGPLRFTARNSSGGQRIRHDCLRPTQNSSSCRSSTAGFPHGGPKRSAAARCFRPPADGSGTDSPDAPRHTIAADHRNVVAFHCADVLCQTADTAPPSAAAHHSTTSSRWFCQSRTGPVRKWNDPGPSLTEIRTKARPRHSCRPRFKKLDHTPIPLGLNCCAASTAWVSMHTRQALHEIHLFLRFSRT